MSFGEKIKNARKAHGYTQRQLAAKIGAKHNSVSDWENDKNKPDPDTIELLCGILELEPNYLMGNWKNKSDYFIHNTLIEFKSSEEKDIIDGLTLNLVQLNKNGLNKVVSYTNDLLNINEYRKAPLEDRSYLAPQAAHERTDIEVTDEMRQHDDDIMNDDNF